MTNHTAQDQRNRAHRVQQELEVLDFLLDEVKSLRDLITYNEDRKRLQEADPGSLEVANDNLRAAISRLEVVLP